MCTQLQGKPDRPIYVSQDKHEEDVRAHLGTRVLKGLRVGTTRHCMAQFIDLLYAEAIVPRLTSPL
jgi:hypothetical protein